MNLEGQRDYLLFSWAAWGWFFLFLEYITSQKETQLENKSSLQNGMCNFPYSKCLLIFLFLNILLRHTDTEASVQLGSCAGFFKRTAEAEPAHVHGNQQIVGHRRTVTRCCWSITRPVSLSLSLSVRNTLSLSIRCCARPAALSDSSPRLSCWTHTRERTPPYFIFHSLVFFCFCFSLSFYKRGLFLGGNNGLRDVARSAALIRATECRRRA